MGMYCRMCSKPDTEGRINTINIECMETLCDSCLEKVESHVKMSSGKKIELGI